MANARTTSTRTNPAQDISPAVRAARQRLIDGARAVAAGRTLGDVEAARRYLRSTNCT